MRLLNIARSACLALSATFLALAAGCAGHDRAATEDGDARIAMLHERAAVDALPPGVRDRVESKLVKKVEQGPPTGGPAAVDFFLHQRVQEGMAYPIEMIREEARKAEDQAKRLVERARLRGEPKTEPFIDGWTELGPGNIGGRTRALVISPDGPGSVDPDDEGFMVAAGVAGGIFRSEDGGASWTPVGDLLENIAVSALAMDPEDPDVIYAGTGEGFFNGDAVRGLGLFKSTDGGRTWSRLESSVFPQVPGGSLNYVNKIAISPADPDRIYVAARTGVWRHDNAGELEDPDSPDEMFLWENVLGNPFFAFGNQISNGSILGATDVQVEPPAGDGSTRPLEDEIVVAAFGGIAFDDGLFLSVNGGDRWFRQTDQTGASEDEVRRIDTAAQGRMTIAFAPRGALNDTSHAYVLMARNENRFGQNIPDAARDIPSHAVIDVFRADMNDIDIETDDDGEVTSAQAVFEPRLEFENPNNHLHELLLSNTLFSGVCNPFLVPPYSPTFSQGFYDNIIKVDPEDPEIVWVGGIDIFRSDDGARNFGIAGYWQLDGADEAGIHADQHEIVFHPGFDGMANQTMYVTNDGGIYRTDNARAPVAVQGCPDEATGNISQIVWEDLNNGYGVTQFYHGDTGTTTTGGRDMFLGGTQDNGTPRSLRRSCTEQWTEILGGDGGYVAVDPTDNDTVYAETQNFGTIRRIRFNPAAGTETVSFISGSLGFDTGLFITPFTMDPSNPGTLWTAGARPWRTTNADTPDPADVEWVAAGPNFGRSGNIDFVARVSAIAVAPSDPNVVYMGFEDGWIARTTNALEPDPDDIVWEILQAGLPVDGDGYISSLAVDPDDPDVVWATNSRFFQDFEFTAHVYRGTIEETIQGPFFIFRSMDGIDCDPDDDIDTTLPDVPAHWVELRKCGSVETVFVGTEIGVFASSDAWDPPVDCDPNDTGSPLPRITWRYINIPDDTPPGADDMALPRTVVETLAFRDPNTLVAFTHGRGAFIADLATECPGVPEDEPCNAADLVAPFGLLDPLDIQAFLGDFSAGRLSADMPVTGTTGCGNGVLDAQDLLRFGELHSGGCP